MSVEDIVLRTLKRLGSTTAPEMAKYLLKHKLHVSRTEAGICLSDLVYEHKIVCVGWKVVGGIPWSVYAMCVEV